MAVLSAILYFFNHHYLLAIPAIWMLGSMLASCMASRFKNRMWYGIGILGMVAGIFNAFFGSTLNGAFLNAFGTTGSAVITHSEQTNSQLNDQYIDAYAGVMRTADGRDVKIEFDTMSATLYPWRNAIEIPPTGERFVVKYIPGFERNIAIMRDESPYGQRILMRQARAPLDQAKALMEASPDNAAFRQEYIEAVRQFLDQYGDQADADWVRALEADIGRGAVSPDAVPHLTEPAPTRMPPAVPAAPPPPPPRTIETLADGPDVCFRAIVRHLGAQTKVYEMTAFFSPGPEFSHHGARPEGQLTTCTVQYQDPDNPRRLLDTHMNLQTGTFSAPEPARIMVARHTHRVADFRLEDVLIPLSSMHPEALTSVMQAQASRLGAVYSRYVWSGVRLSAPDVFRPTHTLRLDLDGRLAANDIETSGYASVSLDGTRIVRDHLMP